MAALSSDPHEMEERFSLLTENTRVRVSSVLNRDCSHYGKKYMFDKNEDTCWNSDQVRHLQCIVEPLYCSLLDCQVIDLEEYNYSNP